MYYWEYSQNLLICQINKREAQTGRSLLNKVKINTGPSLSLIRNHIVFLYSRGKATLLT